MTQILCKVASCLPHSTMAKLLLIALLSSAAAAMKPLKRTAPMKNYAALEVRGGGIQKATYVKAVTGIYALRAYRVPKETRYTSSP